MSDRTVCMHLYYRMIKLITGKSVIFVKRSKNYFVLRNANNYDVPVHLFFLNICFIIFSLNKLLNSKVSRRYYFRYFSS